MRAPKRRSEGRSLGWSRWTRRANLGLLALVVGVLGESVWWTTQNNLPLGYAFLKPLWVLGYTPEPEMVEVPTGSFIMGCVEGRDDLNGECPKEETPSREVTIPRPFTMGKYEVTFLQYDTYVFHQRRSGKDVDYPDDAYWGRFGRPVINVSWNDAQDYAEWLRERTGKSYRLPTEVEWEYAARAGTPTAYWWGKAFDESRANCGRWNRTAPVGSFGKDGENPFRLHDTAGNGWEWVEDAYGNYTEGSAAASTAIQPDHEIRRVLRGGSWSYVPGGCRAAGRDGLEPDDRSYDLSFRLCCSSPIE